MNLERNIYLPAGSSYEVITKRPDLSSVSNLDVTVDGTDLDAADGVVSIEESDDEISWSPIAELEITLPSGNSNQNAVKGSQSKKKYKIVYTPNSVTTGIVHICFKGNS